MSAWEDHFRGFLLRKYESEGRDFPTKNHDVPACHLRVDDLKETVASDDSNSIETEIRDENTIVPNQQELGLNRKVLNSFNLPKVSEIGDPSQPQNIPQQKRMKDSSQVQPILPATESLAHGPTTFYPTLQELGNFVDYVAYMESKGAHKGGLATIVPPKDWVPRKVGYDLSDMNDITIITPVMQRKTTSNVAGAFMIMEDRSLPSITVPEYYVGLAGSSRYLAPSHESLLELEEVYWNQIEDDVYPTPTYGVVEEASLTDPDQITLNFSNLHDLLTEVEGKFPAKLSHLQLGMWKSTCCWRVEDMDLYGVNYLHYGAPKTWYCVPPQYGYKLEQLAQRLFPDFADECFNLLRHKTVMISPEILKANGIPFKKVVQEEGTIVVVFPHSYHAEFSHGFNIAEANNFALPRWVDYGKRFRFCICKARINELRLDMEEYVEKIQPDKLECWKSGNDFELHPEDPDFLKLYLEDLGTKFGLGLIKKHLFGKLKDKLKTKREIDPWFKKKFSVEYAHEYNFDLGCQTVIYESENSGNGSDLNNKVVHGANKKEDINKSVSKVVRRQACAVCSGCLEKNCNVCVNCLDKVSNGGENTRKRKCIKRICRNPIMPGN